VNNTKRRKICGCEGHGHTNRAIWPANTRRQAELAVLALR